MAIMRQNKGRPLLVTIVPAWISADTGVGPSIASGNQSVQDRMRRFTHRAINQPDRNQVSGGSIRTRESPKWFRRRSGPSRPKNITPNLIESREVNSAMTPAESKSPRGFNTKALMRRQHSQMAFYSKSRSAR